MPCANTQDLNLMQRQNISLEQIAASRVPSDARISKSLMTVGKAWTMLKQNILKIQIQNAFLNNYIQ